MSTRTPSTCCAASSGAPQGNNRVLELRCIPCGSCRQKGNSHRPPMDWILHHAARRKTQQFARAYGGEYCQRGNLPHLRQEFIQAPKPSGWLSLRTMEKSITFCRERKASSAFPRRAYAQVEQSACLRVAEFFPDRYYPTHPLTWPLRGGMIGEQKANICPPYRSHLPPKGRA
jgi:hypothetical protein